MRHDRTCGFLAFALLCAADLGAQEAVSILKQKCFQCHGDALQMSKLDLRTRESMLKGGEKGPAIVPGNAEKSPLYRRVAGLEQPAMPMAPLPPLAPKEVAALKEWIAQGATWTDATTSQSQQPTGGYGKDYKE